MAHLSIKTLGTLQVSLAGKLITGFESAKVRALLVYLAVEADRSHSRPSLLGLFWPDYPEESARHSLRQALFNLRSVLEDPTAATPYLLISREAIQFNRASDYTLDLEQFNQHYLACKETLSLDPDHRITCPPDMEEMVELYQGEFLQDFFVEDSERFENWALVQRESTHQRVLDAYSYLADYYESHGELQAARKHASRQLELDPWREEAHRQLMRLLALDGQRSAALAQYEACKRVLADELDVEPSSETRELYEQIKLCILEPKTGQPSRAPTPPVHNLPVQLTPFVGREHELAYLGQLMNDPECRCITLVGPGGIGKTRLAVQIAGNHSSQFTHGVAFVSLASVEAVVGVIPAITHAINFSFYGPSAPKDQLLNYLHDKHMLLILDNLEQLLVEQPLHENITDLLIEILQNASGIKLLVTTREALNLQGEWIFEVPGLTFPETERTGDLHEFDAVTLFVQRARRLLPGFTLDDKNRTEIVRICHLVEGMPLAIELAATWMRVLTPAEIAQEIESSLDFLSTTAHDLPERHRSMRAVFDGSWQMLSPDEQSVLKKLSVFRGGFQRQAAEQVAGATLSILSMLVNRTLLWRTSAGRYDLHELVRQYSASQLAADPQAQAEVQRRHYAFYLGLAETAAKGLKGSNQVEWLNTLEQDHDNLGAAMEWATKCGDTAPCDDDLALRLSGALRLFWRIRGHLHEGRDWLMKALYHASDKHTAARAGALLGLSLLINAMGDMSLANTLAEESALIYEELGDQQGLAESHSVSGLIFRWQGDEELSRIHLEAALAIYRKLGDFWGEAQVLYRMGMFLSDYGGESNGRTMLEESAVILEGLGEKYLLTSVLIALGIGDMGSGNYRDAKIRFERALTIGRELNHTLGITDALTNLGCLFRIQGEYDAAQSQFEEALRIYQEHGRNIWLTDVLCALAENDIARGDPSAARYHLQATSNLIESSENKWLQVLVSYFQGLLAYYEGDSEQADAKLAQSIALAREGHYKPDLARSLIALGRLKIRLGESSLAVKLFQEGLGLFQELGHKLGLATALEGLASASLAQEESEHAVRLFATAHTLRESLGAALPPIDRADYDAALAACRLKVGEAAFAEVWAEASKSPYQEAVEGILR